MTTKLHELLAVEKTKSSAANKLIEETIGKFKKEQFFTGYIKTLAMLADSPENRATEEASKEVRELPTTVQETLAYLFGFWNDSEDVIYAKNVTNQRAVADLLYNDKVLVKDVPVDELLGLEVRLETLRRMFEHMPTLDASKAWVANDSGRDGEHEATNKEVTSKTEKTMTAVVLYDATDKHPAQIERVTADKVVGTFTRTLYSGAATSKQKANIMATVDALLIEAKQARMRANMTEASTDKIGSKITNLLMAAFDKKLP
jgi:hypothetical protein